MSLYLKNELKDFYIIGEKIIETHRNSFVKNTYYNFWLSNVLDNEDCFTLYMKRFGR